MPIMGDLAVHDGHASLCAILLTAFIRRSEFVCDQHHRASPIANKFAPTPSGGAAIYRCDPYRPSHQPPPSEVRRVGWAKERSDVPIIDGLTGNDGHASLCPSYRLISIVRRSEFIRDQHHRARRIANKLAPTPRGSCALREICPHRHSLQSPQSAKITAIES